MGMAVTRDSNQVTAFGEVSGIIGVNYYPLQPSDLPDFTFGIGNGTFAIPGTYMLYQREVTSTTCITIVTGDNFTHSSHEYTFSLGWSQLGMLVLDYENYQAGFMNKSSPLPIFDIPSLEVTL
jgi:hypothetical protein